MTPKLTTARDKIRGVAQAWRSSYGPEARGGKWYTGGINDDREATYERLLALDVETATAEDVRAIIGNGSWTQLHCDGCDEYVNAVVTLGQEPDYESRTADVCRDCFDAALTLFDCREHEDCRDNPTTLGRACARSVPPIGGAEKP